MNAVCVSYCKAEYDILMQLKQFSEFLGDRMCYFLKTMTGN